jgi:hypothetical protein
MAPARGKRVCAPDRSIRKWDLKVFPGGKTFEVIHELEIGISEEKDKWRSK